MNYFELHVGDYDAATAHLSMLEDAAYGRMLRVYYRTERPLPVDVKQVCRLVRAASKPERDAVQAVLEEFFDLRADGWHQDRCDAELQEFHEREPEREARRTNEETRMKRHREERAALFKLLNNHGQHAPWNTKIEELRRLTEPFKAAAGNQPATQPATLQPLQVTQPATAPATPATATHGNVSPPPTSHLPEVKEVSVGAKAPTSSAAPTSGQTPKPAKPSGPPEIPPPYGDIVDAYHEVLPELPRVQLRTGKTWVKRQRAMAERWRFVLTSTRSDGQRRATNGAEAMAWIREFFSRARSNDWLMGRTPPGKGHEGWRCDFDFLLSEAGLKAVVERTEVAA